MSASAVGQIRQIKPEIRLLGVSIAALVLSLLCIAAMAGSAPAACDGYGVQSAVCGTQVK